MTTTDTTERPSAVTWDKPGPGSWVLDTHHTGPTPSRPVRDLFREASRTGSAIGFALLGAPLERMEIEFVHGRFYRRFVPAVGGSRDLPTPPGPVLWLAARTVPTFRRLERQARLALDQRLWRTELTRWDEEWSPSITEANEAFAAVDPNDLDDDALADHVGALWAHLRETTALHFRLHASDAGPIGLLLAATDEWGVPRDHVLACLAGASPATNAPAIALGEIRAAVADARRLQPDAPVATIEDLRALGQPVTSLVDAYLHRFGWRLTTGYDLTDRVLAELPELVARTCAAAPDAPLPGATTQHLAVGRGTDAVADVTAQVPAEHRAELGQLIDDARECYGLRDENGPITYEWPAGLLRRALLAAGDRLTDDGRLRDGDHVFDATVAETIELLRGRGPSAAELATRWDQRRSWADLVPPTTLGPPEAFPPAWAMPPAMRRLVGATLAIVELLDADVPDPEQVAGSPTPTGPVRGTGIGTEPVTATGRLVHEPEDLDHVEPGDILVTARTVPTFNAVLTIVGGLVVEEGGPMSHAAVMARELGIPAVIGATGALASLADGRTITVDPVAGTATAAG